MALPAWFASTLQVPTPMNDTTAPEIEQIVLADASIVRVTAKAEGDAVAVAVYVGPPNVAEPGAVEVKLIVWLPFATEKLCWTCGAAL